MKPAQNQDLSSVVRKYWPLLLLFVGAMIFILGFVFSSTFGQAATFAVIGSITALIGVCGLIYRWMSKNNP